jgi:hypothetical protein
VIGSSFRLDIGDVGITLIYYENYVWLVFGVWFGGSDALAIPAN